MAMSYQSFIKQVEKCLQAMPAEALRQLILRWAEDQKPENRHPFLERLQQTPGPDHPDREDDVLIGAVQAFHTRVRTGDYCVNETWQGTAEDEDYEQGDTSWAREMDGFLTEARRRMLGKQYTSARMIYELLFLALEEGYDPGHLPGDPDPENMLQEQLDEHLSLYFRAVYLTAAPPERPQQLYQAVSRNHVFAARFCLMSINEALADPLPDLAHFVPQWIAYLLEHPFARDSRLVRDALRLQADDWLAVFARTQAERFPGAYVDWLDRMLARDELTEAVAVAREALQAIEPDLCIRAQAGDRLALAGERLKDRHLQLEGWSAAFYSSPDLPRLLQLYRTGWLTATFARVWQAAVDRLLALQDQPLKPGHDQQDPDLRLAWGDKLLLAHAQLLRGGFEAAMQMARTSGPLGWTYGANPKPVIYFFFVAALTPADRRYPWIFEQWQAVVQKTAYQGESSLFGQYQELADRIFKQNPASPARQEALLNWLLQETSARIAAIVNNKYRSSYHKAAVLLAVMAQTYSSLGRQQEGRDLISQVEVRYLRYSAFRSEIQQACHQINWN